VAVESVASVNVSAEGASAATGATVPLNATVCGEPLTLSAIFNVAERAPVLLPGAKLTETVHEVPTATLVPQSLVWEKLEAFVPVIDTPVRPTAIAPVFVMVTDCAAVAVKFSDEGVTEMDGRAFATATPVSVAVWMVPATPFELSVTVTAALRVPAVVGVKLTVMVQLLPAVSVLQLFVSEKSAALAPVIATLETVSVPLPEF